MTTPLPEEWSKRFDKDFPLVLGNKYSIANEIKWFIRSLLLQSYEQGKREMLIKVVQWMNKQGYEGLQEEFVNALTKEEKV